MQNKRFIYTEHLQKVKAFWYFHWTLNVTLLSNICQGFGGGVIWSGGWSQWWPSDPQSSDSLRIGCLLWSFQWNNPLNMTQQNPDSISVPPVVCELLSISQCIYWDAVSLVTELSLSLYLHISDKHGGSQKGPDRSDICWSALCKLPPA